MAAIHSTESCSDCLYWMRGDVIGQCRRFPVSETKHQNSWCGEYSEITFEKLSTEFIRLYDQIDEQKKIDAEIIAKSNAEVELPKVKRGRPAKDKSC